MRVSKRAAVALLAIAALAGSATTAISALGHDGGRSQADHRGRGGATVFAATLAPSVPLTDPMLHGANPGGAPWVLRRGEARLRRDGRLAVRVRGLVIPDPPGDRTPGPVTTVSASLYCGNDTTAVGTTPSVPISRRGDARMAGKFSLPAKCLAPVVLVHPNGLGGAYIAASGFGG
jgi:hypothetical protein